MTKKLDLNSSGITSQQRVDRSALNTLSMLVDQMAELKHENPEKCKTWEDAQDLVEFLYNEYKKQVN